MRTKPPHLALRTAIALVACFGLGVSGSGLGATARADTKAQLHTAQTQLEQLLAQAHAAAARRNRAAREVAAILADVAHGRQDLEATTVRLLDAQFRERDLDSQLDAQQGLVDDRARTAYENPGSSLDALLSATSWQDLQSRMIYLDAVTASDQMLVDGLGQRRTAVAEARAQLDDLHQQMLSSQARVEDDAAYLTSRLAEQQSAVSELGQAVAQAQILVNQLHDRLAREQLVTYGDPPGVPFPPGTVGVRALIVRDFAPLGPKIVAQALCVGYHESRYDPNAVNQSSGAAGVFQFMPQIWPPMSTAAGLEGANVFDPKSNVAVAAWAVSQYGWSPWTLDGPYCGF